MTYILFYLLLLLIPTQIGRHFFFDFSTISGLRSDYLAPTIYLTDIIAILLIVVSLRGSRRHVGRCGNLSIYLLFVICYLLFNALIIASNKWAAFYKFLKIIEFILLGVSITKLKPKFSLSIVALSVGVFYSSFLALWQFLIQKSIGGIFWFLGERTFYASTPGIAAFFIPPGRLLLRPYAAFPHPNVLGGFMAIILPLILYYLIRTAKKSGTFLKTWLILVLTLGTLSLVISFSRLAWVSGAIGFLGIFLYTKPQLHKMISLPKGILLSVFFIVMVLSVILLFVLPESFFTENQYWLERADLGKIAIAMSASNLPFGVGLNNFIVLSKNYAFDFPKLYFLQPVHNIYLLILTETGIVGLLLFLVGFSAVFNKVFKTKTVLIISLIQLFILGLFDHYLVTLQQGQLLLVILIALIFSKKVAYLI